MTLLNAYQNAQPRFVAAYLTHPQNDVVLVTRAYMYMRAPVGCEYMHAMCGSCWLKIFPNAIRSHKHIITTMVMITIIINDKNNTII